MKAGVFAAFSVVAGLSAACASQAIEASRFNLKSVEEGSADVAFDLAPDLPAVRGNRSALAQALDDLVDNAVKYSTVVNSLHIRGAASGGRVTVSVADRGVGIHEDEIDRVSDRFFRGRNATERGSGLGLAIARRIVEDHHGGLSVRSTPGEGTRVELTLPAVSAS